MYAWRMCAITTPRWSRKSASLLSEIQRRLYEGSGRERFPITSRVFQMSTLPATAAQPDHRLLYFGGAAFLIASALLGLAIWTENNVSGYPAFVAGLFCIASLGIVFAAVGRAVQGV